VRLAMANFKNIYESLEKDFWKFFPYLIEATESYRKDYGSFLLPSSIN
jgi:hypothetical protein